MMDDVSQKVAFLEFQTRKNDSVKINLQVEDRWTRYTEADNQFVSVTISGFEKSYFLD